MCVRVYESVCMFVSANVGVSVHKYEAVHQCKHVSMSMSMYMNLCVRCAYVSV